MGQSFDSTFTRKQKLEWLNQSIESVQRQEESQRRIGVHPAPRYADQEPEDSEVYQTDRIWEGQNGLGFQESGADGQMRNGHDL